MRGNALLVCCFVAFLSILEVRPALAQQEVYHPGETYDSLQAGQDAYWNAEAQRRALVGRQLMIEEQIMLQNTWADPQDKYRPVGPESHGPIVPKTYTGRTLADVYAYPPIDAGPVYYGGTPAPGGVRAPMASNDRSGSYAAPVPVFQPWPQVPNDIWGTPYYSYVRQPIGHVKIWTGPASYIYKPIYATPPMEIPRPASAAAARPRRQLSKPELPAADVPSPTALLNSPPPPPKPSLPRPGRPALQPGEQPDWNPGNPGPNRIGQEL